MMKASAGRGRLPQGGVAVTDEPPTAVDPVENGTTSAHLRGSSLLLLGRIISIGLNFAVQIVTVRYLSKQDYGAFAYALGVVSMGASFILLGLGRTVGRFVPLFERRGDQARMFGTIAVAVTTVLALGVALCALVIGFHGILTGRLAVDDTALHLIVVLIALAPAQALDNVLQYVLAIFASPRAIFFRRHLLGPGLRLAAVGVVVGAGRDVETLAYGYLVGGLVGVAVAGGMVLHVWRRQGLLPHLRLRALRWPVRELLAFSIPTVGSDVVLVLRTSLVLVIIERFHATSEVAAYRAVEPVAHLNVLALEAFAFLFIPMASRLFARHEHDAIGDLYRQTSLWISALSFPVIALCIAFPRSVTVLLFGPRYADSAPILAILAVGHYVNAALGFNAHVLRVYGRVGRLAVNDAATAGFAVAAYLVLVPRYGALGAAYATSGTYVVNNVLNQVALARLPARGRLVDRRHLRVHVSIAVLTAALAGLHAAVSLPLVAGVGLAACGAAGIVLANRTSFRIAEVFPEVARLPILRHLPL